jgi:hypothetical protein
LPRIEKKLDSIFKPNKIPRSDSIIEIDKNEFENKENRSNSSIKIVKRKLADNNVLGESVGSFLVKINQQPEKKLKFKIEKQIKINLESSLPLRICLVDEENNQHSNGSLFNHLFLTKTSPCVLCLNCNQFFSISNFTRHSHIKEIIENNLKIATFNESINSNENKEWMMFNEKLNLFSLNELVQKQKPVELFDHFFMDPADREAAIEFFKNFDDLNLFI